MEKQGRLGISAGLMKWPQKIADKSGLPDEAEKTHFLHHCFVAAKSERLPSKGDDAFCLSAACPAGREKGKKYLVYPVILSKH